MIKSILSFLLTALISFFGNAQNIPQVTIGTQTWMSENLNVNKFRNGDPIPEAKSDEEWKQADKNKKPAWCYYQNKSDSGAKYGKLYNWYALNDKRGLAPAGWHVPSDQEWLGLTNYLGGDRVAGTKLKSNSGWRTNGDNSSGFSALPGGGRASYGAFYNAGEDGFWWSSTENVRFSYSAGNFHLNWYNNWVLSEGAIKGYGQSVRCIKD